MKEKILKITILMILLVITCTGIVNALSMSIIMETDKTTIPAGTEFLVSYKATNLDMGENGIASIEGIIDYDKDIFEKISEGSIETLNEWGMKFDDNSSKISLFKNKFTKTDEEVFSVTFKTKKDIDNKDGMLRFKDIKAGETDTSISVEDVSLTIHVGKPEENNANTENKANVNNNVAKLTPSNKANNSTNTKANTNTNTKLSNNVTVNNTSKNVTNTSKEKIPAAGVSNELILLLVGFVIIAIGVYVKIETINKEMKK